MEEILDTVNPDRIYLVETNIHKHSTVKFYNYNQYSSIRSDGSGGLFIGVKASSFKNDIETTEANNSDIISLKLDPEKIQ